MTERDFVKQVARRANYSVPIVREIEESMKKFAFELLVAGENLNFLEFGQFKILHRKGHTGRDLNTMEDVYIAPHYHVKFVPSKKLKDAIDKHNQSR